MKMRVCILCAKCQTNCKYRTKAPHSINNIVVILLLFVFIFVFTQWLSHCIPNCVFEMVMCNTKKSKQYSFYGWYAFCKRVFCIIFIVYSYIAMLVLHYLRHLILFALKSDIFSHSLYLSPSFSLRKSQCWRFCGSQMYCKIHQTKQQTFCKQNILQP